VLSGEPPGRWQQRTGWRYAWLVGEENRGLEYMFIMMNAARFGVGVEGVGIAERAFQRARQYARERIQGTELGANDTSACRSSATLMCGACC